MSFGFKPNPKAQVSVVFHRLYGNVPHDVRGERVTTEGKTGHYLATLAVDGITVATARNHDWRRAYKLLTLEVEKLYADGVVLGR